MKRPFLLDFLCICLFEFRSNALREILEWIEEKTHISDEPQFSYELNSIFNKKLNICIAYK